MRICFLLILVSASSLFGAINQNGDIQFWNRDTIERRIRPRVDSLYEAAFRWRSDAKELFHKHYQLELLFHASRHLKLGPGYRQQFTRTNDKWIKIFSPLFDLFLTFPFSNFTVIDRNRVQYLIIDRKSWTTRFRYRNRLEIRGNWRIRHTIVHPFISEEIFIEERRGFDQNRVKAGFHFPFVNPIYGTLFFMIRHIKHHSSWIHNYVFGANVTFKF